MKGSNTVKRTTIKKKTTKKKTAKKKTTKKRGGDWKKTLLNAANKARTGFTTATTAAKASLAKVKSISSSASKGIANVKSKIDETVKTIIPKKSEKPTTDTNTVAPAVDDATSAQPAPSDAVHAVPTTSAQPAPSDAVHAVPTTSAQPAPSDAVHAVPTTSEVPSASAVDPGLIVPIIEDTNTVKQKIETKFTTLTPTEKTDIVAVPSVMTQASIVNLGNNPPSSTTASIQTQNNRAVSAPVSTPVSAPVSTPVSTPASTPVSTPVSAPEQRKTRKSKGSKNTVTVKIYPNNTNSKDIIIGDYRIVIDKQLPSDIDIVDHFLTNTMKYIKSHTNKYQGDESKNDEVFFPNTKFKYEFIPSE